MSRPDLRVLPLVDSHRQSGAEFTTRFGWQLSADYGDAGAEYETLRSGCGLMDRSYLGRVKVTGETGLDFFHRLTTAPANELQPNQGMETVVTTPEGRFVDWVTLYAHEDHLTMITGPGAESEVIQFLEGYVFFKDDVAFQDTGTEWCQFQLSGPRAEASLEAVFGRDFGENDPYEMTHIRRDESHVYVTPINGMTGQDIQVFVPTEDGPGMWKKLLHAGDGVRPVGLDACEQYRIESGLPRYPFEINDRYTLVEAHLQTALNLEKGCFTGQEVIARTINYNKVKQHLCRLTLQESLPTDWSLPVQIRHNERVIGELTSVAPFPNDAGIPALGYIKTRYLEDIPGDVTVGTEHDRITAELLGKTEPR